MVLWYRIRPSRLRCLSHQCKRWYIQTPGVTSTDCIAGLTRTMDLNRPNSFNQWRTSELRETVRYFAAPVQAKPKPERKDPAGPRLNNQIKAEFVRLVTDEGHTILSRHEALERAKKLNFDLVEVQRTANPPVCKIMDFHKEKYKQQLKDKDRVKSKLEINLRKGDCKEVRFSAKTEPRDLQMKADMVKRLMEKGYRVKCTAMGTEGQDLGGMLSRLSDLIEEVAVVDSGPRVEKRQAYIIVRHIKFSPSKKGPGKKAAVVSESSSNEVQQKATSSPTINSSNPSQGPLQIEGEWGATDSDSESEYDTALDEAETPFGTSVEMHDEELTKNNMTWSAKDANDNFEKVFGLDDNSMNMVTSSSTSGRINGISGPDTPLEDDAAPLSNGRIELMSRFQPTKSTKSSSIDATLSTEFSKFSSVQRTHVSRTPGAMNSGHLGSLSPNQVRQPQRDATASSPTEQKQLGTDASSLRNMKQPHITESLKPQQPHPVTPSSPPKSYGIFSSQKPNVTSKQSAATEVYSGDKERNSFGSANRANSSSSAPTATSHSLKAENSQKPESGKTRQEEWGIFSRELANANRTGTPENRFKVQR